MEAIVLAGGFGTRLKDVIADVPKPMASVAGRPFLEILLSMLARKGFVRVVLSLGYMADKIIDNFGDSYEGMDIFYEVEKNPLGTGGAIRASLEHCLGDHVFIFNGDTYLDVEVDEIERLWHANRNPVIVMRNVDDTARFGRLEVTGGRVTAFLEKGEQGPGLINAGCYLFPRHILDSFTLGQAFSLESDFFIKSLKDLSFDGFVTDGLFIDIGIPEDYKLAQTMLAGI